jgi:sugar phosphate isomerase/epimerase
VAADAVEYPVAFGRHRTVDEELSMAPADHLLATCWSSAGDAASDRADLRSPLPLRERMEGASAAGYTGFGLLSADLPAAEREYGLKGIGTLLDDNGIVDLELEGIPYWWDDGPHRAESDEIRRSLLNAAEVLGARHIKVTPDGDDAPWDPGHWAGKLAELAAQAEDVGTRLGLEFFPWSNIKDLRAGLRLIDDAGHDADPQVVGTLFEDTVHRRRYCGEGSFDLKGIVNALRAAGWTGPWGVEILSAEHRALPVRTALQKAADSARHLLSSAAS